MAGTTWPVHKGARRCSIVCLKGAEKEVGQSLSSDRYWGWFRIELPPPPPSGARLPHPEPCGSGWGWRLTRRLALFLL